MSFRCDLFLALRYFKGKKRNRLLSAISLISVLGITIGVMALIIIISVMNGFQRDLREKILIAQPHIMIQKSGGGLIDHWEDVVKKAKGFRGIKGVYPVIRTQAMALSISGATGLELTGIDSSDAFSRERIEKITSSAIAESIKSSENNSGNDKGIIMGRELARSLAVSTGDMVRIMLPEGRVTPFGNVPTVRKFRVKGIFQSGIYQYDMATAYIDINDARDLLGISNSVTNIDIELKDIFSAGETASVLSGSLQNMRVRTWEEMNKHLFAALKLEKIAMFSILLLIVIVAVFNVANTLIMMVIEKRGDVAILKSIGASSREIMRIFMIEGLLTGFIGTFAGSGLGLLLSFLLEKYEIVKLDDTVFYTSKIPVDVEPLTVALIIVSSLALSFLSTLYPSKYASKLNPAEVLRFD
ncbi:MAG: lipoprotein-releasing ABC transporter permease subunit [Candidatus Schekmanbacteria bacterium]|nr:lipoprotein-releasing ABC transporter permease subunit [Candidatus Schekmanbacteria bacterium]